MDISTEIAAIQAASEGSELRQPLIDALNKINGDTLPVVTPSDVGKILKVGANGWEVGEKSGYMPVPTATKQIEYNGTYDVTDYSNVVVNVSGGGGIPLLTRLEWNALTTAQKQTYGLVALQDNSVGYRRGELVNGADYMPIGVYIPYSNQYKVICEACKDVFDSDILTWGVGDSPVVFTNNNSYYNSTEDAIYIPVAANNTFAGVDLGAAGTAFTAYIVMKLVSPGTYTRIISCFNSRNSGQGIMLYGSTISVSSWANDKSIGKSSSNYFVGAIQFAGSGDAFGVVRNSQGVSSIITKPPTTAGKHVAIARTDTDASTANAEPGNAFVKYCAVVKEAESQQTVLNNIDYLYNVFLAA